MTPVVLDTNVVMSAIFFGGVPLKVLEAWHHERLEVVVSNAVMDEYHEIAERLHRKFPMVDAGKWLDYIEQNARHVTAPPLPKQVCEDADDDVFLSCALAAEANIVCSGDRHLLACNGWSGIEVLTPRAVLDRVSCQTFPDSSTSFFVP